MIHIYTYLTSMHVIVEFKELRPFQHNIKVYYKGIEIGKVYSQRHSNDFTHTEVKLLLFSKKLKIPDNTKVILKKEVRYKFERDFIELIYPETPSSTFIHNGTRLKGNVAIDINELLKNQNPEDIEAIRHNLVLSSENLNTSLEALGQLFIILQDFVSSNKQNVVNTTLNLEKSSNNMTQISSKINNAIQTQQLQNTFDNIEKSSNGLNNISDNFVKTTNDINTYIPMFDTTIQNLNEILTNTNAISCGIRQTLRKPFGGIRLFFGKSIDENNCQPCGK